MTHIPPIGTVMTPFPHFVTVDESLRRARALMVEHQIRHLPVKDGGRLVGVVADRDIKRALDPDLGLPPADELFIHDVFIPDVYVVDIGEPLDRVLEHMADNHLGSALVTKADRLVGIFTMTDACRFFSKHLRSLFPSGPGDSIA